MTSKIALSVDTTNIFHNCRKKFNKKFDYEKFYSFIKDNYGSIYRAFAYGLQYENEAASFISKLRHTGFEVKWEKVEKYEVDGKVVTTKRNMLVPMAMDIVRVIDRLDTLIIGTSNADFVSCVNWVRERGVKVIVYGAQLSQEIREASSKYIEIDENFLIKEEMVI